FLKKFGDNFDSEEDALLKFNSLALFNRDLENRDVTTCDASMYEMMGDDYCRVPFAHIDENGNEGWYSGGYNEQYAYDQTRFGIDSLIWNQNNSNFKSLNDLLEEAYGDRNKVIEELLTFIGPYGFQFGQGELDGFDSRTNKRGQVFVNLGDGGYWLDYEWNNDMKAWIPDDVKNPDTGEVNPIFTWHQSGDDETKGYWGAENPADFTANGGPCCMPASGKTGTDFGTNFADFDNGGESVAALKTALEGKIEDLEGIFSDLKGMGIGDEKSQKILDQLKSKLQNLDQSVRQQDFLSLYMDTKRTWDELISMYKNGIAMMEKLGETFNTLYEDVYNNQEKDSLKKMREGGFVSDEVPGIKESYETFEAVRIEVRDAIKEIIKNWRPKPNEEASGEFWMAPQDFYFDTNGYYNNYYGYYYYNWMDSVDREFLDQDEWTAMNKAFGFLNDNYYDMVDEVPFADYYRDLAGHLLHLKFASGADGVERDLDGGIKAQYALLYEATKTHFEEITKNIKQMYKNQLDFYGKRNTNNINSHDNYDYSAEVIDIDNGETDDQKVVTFKYGEDLPKNEVSLVLLEIKDLTDPSKSYWMGIDTTKTKDGEHEAIQLWELPGGEWRYRITIDGLNPNHAYAFNVTIDERSVSTQHETFIEYIDAQREMARSRQTNMLQMFENLSQHFEDVDSQIRNIHSAVTVAVKSVEDSLEFTETELVAILQQSLAELDLDYKEAVSSIFDRLNDIAGNSSEEASLKSDLASLNSSHDTHTNLLNDLILSLRGIEEYQEGGQTKQRFTERFFDAGYRYIDLIKFGPENLVDRIEDDEKANWAVDTRQAKKHSEVMREIEMHLYVDMMEELRGFLQHDAGLPTGNFCAGETQMYNGCSEYTEDYSGEEYSDRQKMRGVEGLRWSQILAEDKHKVLMQEEEFIKETSLEYQKLLEKIEPELHSINAYDGESQDTIFSVTLGNPPNTTTVTLELNKTFMPLKAKSYWWLPGNYQDKVMYWTDMMSFYGVSGYAGEYGYLQSQLDYAANFGKTQNYGMYIGQLKNGGWYYSDMLSAIDSWSVSFNGYASGEAWFAEQRACMDYGMGDCYVDPDMAKLYSAENQAAITAWIEDVQHGTQADAVQAAIDEFEEALGDYKDKTGEAWDKYKKELTDYQELRASDERKFKEPEKPWNTYRDYIDPVTGKLTDGKYTIRTRGVTESITGAMTFDTESHTYLSDGWAYEDAVINRDDFLEERQIDYIKDSVDELADAFAQQDKNAAYEVKEAIEAANRDYQKVLQYIIEQSISLEDRSGFLSDLSSIQAQRSDLEALKSTHPEEYSQMLDVLMNRELRLIERYEKRAAEAAVFKAEWTERVEGQAKADMIRLIQGYIETHISMYGDKSTLDLSSMTVDELRNLIQIQIPSNIDLNSLSQQQRFAAYTVDTSAFGWEEDSQRTGLIEFAELMQSLADGSVVLPNGSNISGWEEFSVSVGLKFATQISDQGFRYLINTTGFTPNITHLSEGDILQSLSWLHDNYNGYYTQLKDVDFDAYAGFVNNSPYNYYWWWPTFQNQVPDDEQGHTSFLSNWEDSVEERLELGASIQAAAFALEELESVLYQKSFDDEIGGSWSDAFTLASPLVDHQSVVFDAGNGPEIWNIGGSQDGSTPVNTVQSIRHTADGTVTVNRPDLPIALKSASSVVWDGHIYVIGGLTSSGPSDKVFKFDRISNAWIEAASLPYPLTGHQSVVFSVNGAEGIYVTGGESDNGYMKTLKFDGTSWSVIED
ncbi:MAG: hypothetical protein KC649_01455, partial [Candidatus Omnitrophica bacterium]|nr:hypothetical protein [Candidatus Omnitrophota bacterium]